MGAASFCRHVAIRKKLPAGTLQWLSARASNLETLSFSDLKAAADCSQPPLHISRAFDPVFPKPVQSKYLFAPDPALYMPGIEALLRASGATLRSIELTAVSSVFSQGILGRIARHCPNLLQITLNENQFAGAHGGLCQIAAGCPLVESFTISEMEYEMRSKNSSLNDNTMGELVFGWPNLRHISIDRNEVTLRGLCLLRHCENLETLHFGFPRDCGDSFFEGVPGPELMVLSRSLQVRASCLAFK